MPSLKTLPAALLGLALACPVEAESQGMELGQVLIGAEDQSGEDLSLEEAKVRITDCP